MSMYCKFAATIQAIAIIAFTDCLVWITIQTILQTKNDFKNLIIYLGSGYRTGKQMWFTGL